MSAPVLRRLLIANRGEIVCRIARTAKRLGVTSIAVYSDADRHARHVRLADEAYYLGASPAPMSYLNIANLLDLARRVGADSVHPGYGFLSENASFAQACVDAGLIFVGPPAAAIRAMGSKSASKAAMAAIGVPVAPGYHGEDQSPQRLLAESERIGFPLIIKASAGGGGKGMQVVTSAAEVPAAIESARRIARTAFGDDRLLLERYFPQARHVEVQIFADAAGHTVSLFDRDCSVQRRHQKIIEEAPAPGLRDEVRADMSRAAIKTARAVGYVGAGTVEFLLDEAQRFYFMEMNTRLQVEHPVTECITGIDLVEWQLRVAQGEPLPKQQADIAQHGAAIEVRLYAEEPTQGYLPSVGRISHLHWPEPQAGVRLDCGVDCGDEVSMFYDPMLAKIIASGESRSEAIERLRKAVAEVQIIGVATNRAQLLSVLADDEFRRGSMSTSFLDVRKAQLQFGDSQQQAIDCLLAGIWQASRRATSDALWADTRGWRLGAAPRSTWRFGDDAVTVEAAAADEYRLRLNEKEFCLRVIARGADSLAVELNGQRHRVTVIEAPPELHVFHELRHAVLRLVSTEDTLQMSRTAEEGSLLTPLPGTIVAVHVIAGQRILRGAPLVTVEAMKMEHTLTAPSDGMVVRVAFGVGERVAAGAILVELTPAEGQAT